MFFFNFQLTWADIAVAERIFALADKTDPMFVHWFDKLTKEGEAGRTKLVDDYPLLKALSDKVLNLPEIKKWMDKRLADDKEIF